MKNVLLSIVGLVMAVMASAQSYDDLYEILDGQRGKSIIEIPKGTYILDVRSKGAYKFHDMTDVQINGNGSTVICNNQEQAFSFYNCVRVEVRDIIIDYDPLCFTQGKIVDLAQDGSWFDMEIDEGYSIEGLRANRVQLYDPQTRLLKRNSATTYASNYSELRQMGERRYRAVKNGNWSVGESVGDLFVMDVLTDKKQVGAHTIMLNKCYSMKLERITVYGSNTFSILEKECYANHYNGCVVDRGPMPEGIEPRLRSGNADGIHSSQAIKGPTVVNCKVVHNGDDCIIVCGRSFAVGAVDREKKELSLVTRETHPVFRKGDKLVVVGYDGERKGELKMSSISKYDPSQEERAVVVDKYQSLLFKATYKQGFRIKVSAIPFEITAGDVIFNADAVGSGFVIKNNEVGHVRSRGILIKGVNGVVQGNNISGCAMQGILVAPEIEWMGGGFSSNVRIEENTIRECMFERTNPRIPPGSLSVIYINGKGEIAPAGALSDITIQNNRVVDCPYPSIVATSINGLKVLDNQVERTLEVKRGHGSKYGADLSSPIWESQNIMK